MKRAAILTTIIFVARAASGQSAPPKEEALPIISSTSTLVTVPTLVRLPSEEFVKHLNADHFQLFDNGIGQEASVEEMENQPIALTVLLQTGGMGHLQFKNYRNLPLLLDSIVGNSVHEIMLVEFDSHPEEIWHFPLRSDGLKYALTHLRPGDDGAAIMDAVNYVIDQFQQEPGSFRRIILLLSQSLDDGSKSSSEEVVRTLGKASTAVYSITFSTRARFRPDHVAKPASPLSPGNGHLNDSSDRASSLCLVLKALHENTAAEIATLSGGEHLTFRDQPGFEQQLSTVADDIHNTYMLSFRPTSPEPGFRTLAIRVAGKRSHFNIVARTSYWFDSVPSGK